MATPQTEKSKSSAKRTPPPTAPEEKAATTDVAVKQAAPLATQPDKVLGASEGLNAQDLLIPRIYLMQGLSKLVAERKAQQGEFRGSLDGKLLGSPEKPVEIFLISSFKTWVIFEWKADIKNGVDNGKFEYTKTVPVDPENAGWEIEEVINGVKIRRDRALNYFVLTSEDTKEGSFFPSVISFRRTGHVTGKKLATLSALQAQLGQNSWNKVYALIPKLTTNDKGTFYTIDVGPTPRAATDEEKVLARQAYDFVEATKSVAKIDDSVERHETEVSTHQQTGDESKITRTF